MGGRTFKRKAPFAAKNGGGLIFEGGPIFITVAIYLLLHPCQKNSQRSIMHVELLPISKSDEWPH